LKAIRSISSEREMGQDIESALRPVFVLLKLLGGFPEGPILYKIYSVAIILCNLITSVSMISYFTQNIGREYNSIMDFSSTVFCLLAILRQLGHIYFVLFNGKSFRKLLNSVNALIKLLSCSKEVSRKAFKLQIYFSLIGAMMIISFVIEGSSYAFTTIHSVYIYYHYFSFAMVIAYDLTFSAFALTSKIMIATINNNLQKVIYLIKGVINCMNKSNS